MVVVFLRKRVTKHAPEFAYTAQTFQGDVWQEAQAVIDVEERWSLFADASEIAQTERSRMKFADGMSNTPTSVVLTCMGGVVVTGFIREVGADVVVVQESDIQYAAARLQSVLRIEGVVNALRGEIGTAITAAPLTMTSWLRSLTHEVIHCTMIDSWTLRGEVREVGEDFTTLRTDDHRSISLVTPHMSVVRSVEISV